MNLKLTVYTDESLSEVKRVVESDGLKVPYRTSMYIIQSLDEVDLNNENDLLKLITGNVGTLDKIIKATFKVTDSELDCIDTSEIIEVAKELYQFTIEKIKNMKGNDSKNSVMTE